jgi:hypothetical protein
MLSGKVDQELFLPWTFDDAGTRSFLQPIQNHAVVDAIVTVLQQRQFSLLWLDMHMSQMLSTTCLICGGTFHPAVLREHVKTIHPASCVWLPEILPQLLPAFTTDIQNDYKCFCCGLVYNLPPADDLTAEQQVQRAHLVQIHAQHHCPVLYQSGLLLTHGLLGLHGRHADGGCRDTGGLQGHGTPADGQIHPGHPRGKRLKTAQTQSASRRPSSTGRRHHDASAHGIHDFAAGKPINS